MPGGEPPPRRSHGDDRSGPASQRGQFQPNNNPNTNAPAFQPWQNQTPPQRHQPRPGYQPQFQQAAPPPSTRERRPRRGIWIALLIVVVLLLIGGGGIIAYANARAGAVAQAAQRYCAALLADDYAAAYNTLTSSLQSQTPRDQFIADGKLHDQIDGRVTQCAASNAASGPLAGVSQIANASLTLNTTLRRAVVYTGPLTLTQQGNDWKIATVAASLQGTALAPLKTGQAFCAALVAGNYAAAYGLLSSGQQSQVSQQQFASQFTDTFTGSPIQLAGCDLDLATYFVSGTTAKVNARLTITNPQASSGLLTVALTIIQQSGSWKIDDIHLTN